MDALCEMAILFEQPVFALAPAAVFSARVAISTHRLVLAALLCWVAAVPYEYGVKLRVLCSGACNIHIDLLLSYPALIVVSVVALVAFSPRAWRNGHA